VASWARPPAKNGGAQRVVPIWRPALPLRVDALVQSLLEVLLGWPNNSVRVNFFIFCFLFPFFPFCLFFVFFFSFPVLFLFLFSLFVFVTFIKI
jgi:hypothetical protein